MNYVKDFKVKGKVVMVRCDFNEPIDDAGNLLDDFRITKSLPTIQYLVKQKAKVILMSHLGKPNGDIVEILRLNKVKERLEKLLEMPVIKADDVLGVDAGKKAALLQPGQVLLLENVRFCREEETNDLAFAQKLAHMGHFYVNDAFSDCHRSHATIASLPLLLPSCAGMLLESEIQNLNKILVNPKKPVVVLVGGIKVETKAKFIESISHIASAVLVSGLIKKEIKIKELQFSFPEKILGPINDLSSEDISPDIIELFKETILSAKTIVWNGPFGKFEEEQYKRGTLEVAKAVVASRAFSVVGGGETIEFLRKEGMLDKFSHVSTGGGAMLAYLAGEVLPGLKALEDNANQN